MEFCFALRHPFVWLPGLKKGKGNASSVERLLMTLCLTPERNLSAY